MTPAPMKKSKSRWDETPLQVGATPAPTPSYVLTRGRALRVCVCFVFVLGYAESLMRALCVRPSGFDPNMMTPLVSAKMGAALSAEQAMVARVRADIDERNRPMTDEELDGLLPGPADGYKITEVSRRFV